MFGIQVAWVVEIVYLMLLSHPLGIVLAKMYGFIFTLFSTATFGKLTRTVGTKSNF